MFKNKNGMSLVTMVMTVLIMLIILTTLTFTAYTNITIRGLNKLYNDIRTLDDEVAVYYLKNNELPVGDEYATIYLGDTLGSNISFVTTDGTFDSKDDLINPNDYDETKGQAKYYVLNVNLFDNISLQYTGTYIINEQSHMIYYVDGVTIDDITYHNLPLNYENIDYDAKLPISTISTSDVYLPMGGTTLNLEDYITFLASDGTKTTAKSITYSATTSGYTSYFYIEDGKITSTSAEASTTAFQVVATIESYGNSTVTQTANLTVYLTDLKILDSNLSSEVTTLNLLKGEKVTLYVQKTGNSGKLTMLADVSSGNGIDASISNTEQTVSNTSVYTLTIQATNSGTVNLTVLESNGKASKEIVLNIYNPTVDQEELNFTSLDDDKEIKLTLDDIYEFEEDGYEVIWSSSNSSIVKVSEISNDGLKATITPISFGSANIYCKITINDEEFTTIEIPVTITGVSISDLSITSGNTTTLSYNIDSNLLSSNTISSVSWNSSNTTIAMVEKDNSTNYGKITAVSAGTSTIQVTITLSNGDVYKGTCTVTVN